MLTLFHSYKDAGKISEALLVGRNAFNRAPGDPEIFEAYFSYLCTLAETLPSLADKSRFAEQADVALAFYTENAALTEAVVSGLMAYQSRLDEIFRDINERKQAAADAERREAERHNTECLKKLYPLKEKLRTTSARPEFDAIMAELSQIDAEICEEDFTPEQRDTYCALTKEYQDLTGAKMRELEYKENVAYNKQAAAAFEEAFNRFRGNEGKYQNQAQLFSLVSATLFAYDASRLFNETLIYYNHVYSYIFSKLDDRGKFALTRFSIECERKQR